MSSFFAPIDTTDPRYQYIQQQPKCELHAHFTGSVSKGRLRKIAEQQDKMPAYNAFLEQRSIVENRVEYEKCFRFFEPVEQLLGVDKPSKSDEELQLVRQNIIKGMRSVCKQYARDNVTYVELRTGLKCIREGEGFRPYLDAVLEGIRQGEEKYKIEVNLILSLRCNTEEADCIETIALAKEHQRPRGVENNDPLKKVVAIDRSGNSTVGDITQVQVHLHEAREAGLGIALHSGESPKELIDGQKQSEDLRTVNPERVGHAVHIYNREDLRKRTLELCPTTGYYASLCDEEDNHPLLQALREGNGDVVICCDDIAMVRGLTLTSEIYRVARFLKWSEEQIQANIDLAFARRFTVLSLHAAAPRPVERV